MMDGELVVEAGEFADSTDKMELIDSSRDESTDTPQREYMRAKDKITNL
jgi:hypothetical protein